MSDHSVNLLGMMIAIQACTFLSIIFVLIMSLLIFEEQKQMQIKLNRILMQVIPKGNK